MKKIYYYIKRNIIKQSILNILFLRYNCNKILIGNPGCGFYVCPDLLNLKLNSNNKIVSISGGVGDDVSFDIELNKKFTVSETHLFDPTPLTIDWIKNHANLPNGFHFHPFGIAGNSGIVDFYLSDTETASSSSSSSMINSNRFITDNKIQIHVKSLNEIVESLGYSYIDVLKLDIEGSEFEVIESLGDIQNIEFGQICIEFHQRFFKNRWKVLKNAVETLSVCGYKCFSVNWNIMEFSFINTNIAKKYGIK